MFKATDMTSVLFEDNVMSFMYDMFNANKVLQIFIWVFSRLLKSIIEFLLTYYSYLDKFMSTVIKSNKMSSSQILCMFDAIFYLLIYDYDSIYMTSY